MIYANYNHAPACPIICPGHASFVLMSGGVKAANNDSLLYQKVLSQIIRCDVENIDDDIEKITDNDLKLYLKHYCQFWQLMVIKNDISSDKYYAQFNLSVQKINKDRYDLLSQMYLQKCVVDYSLGKNISALRSFVSAYANYKSLKDKGTNSGELLKLSGLYNVLLGSLSDAQLSLLGWFGYEGDKTLGFEELTHYMDVAQGEGAQLEALMYYAYANLKLGEDDDLIQSLFQLPQDKWQGVFMKSLQVQCAFKVHEFDSVETILQEETDFWLLRYLKIKYLLLNQKEEFRLAEEYLSDETISDYKGDVLKYMAWCAFSKGDTVGYKTYMNRILALSAYPTEADKHAKYLAENMDYPNRYLLQARMWFDVGNCRESLDVLLSEDLILLANEKLEYYYRLARNYDVLNNQQDAKRCYKKALSLAEEDDRYFGPYAAIYIAQIYVEEGEVDFAIDYLNKAKKLNTGEYKNAISHEAEMALKSLSDSQ